jgi:CheY-like chemotaxis protein
MFSMQRVAFACSFVRWSTPPLANPTLTGKSVLVLEDEFLIAMDVEQMCRDHGAREVAIMRSIADAEAALASGAVYDAAIVDVMLSGNPTLDFAQRLRAEGVPFVFATGYAQSEDLFEAFPGVTVVAKPYAGDAIVEAITSSIARKAS